MKKTIRTEILIFLMIPIFLTTLALPLFAEDKKPKPPSPQPRCERCYRGPDGKIKCDPVPCPPKK